VVNLHMINKWMNVHVKVQALISHLKAKEVILLSDTLQRQQYSGESRYKGQTDLGSLLILPLTCKVTMVR
jgi:hypothetical protein